MARSIGAKGFGFGGMARGPLREDGAGFQPWLYFRFVTRGVAPGWDEGAPLALWCRAKRPAGGSLGPVQEVVAAGDEADLAIKAVRRRYVIRLGGHGVRTES